MDWIVRVARTPSEAGGRQGKASVSLCLSNGQGSSGVPISETLHICLLRVCQHWLGSLSVSLGTLRVFSSQMNRSYALATFTCSPSLRRGDPRLAAAWHSDGADLWEEIRAHRLGADMVSHVSLAQFSFMLRPLSSTLSVLVLEWGKASCKRRHW